LRAEFLEGSAKPGAVAEAMGTRDRLQAQLNEVSDGQRRLVGHIADGIGGSVGGSLSLFDDPNTVSTLEQVGHSRAPIGSMMLGQVASREELMRRMRSGVVDPSMQAADSAGGVVDFAEPTDPARSRWYGIVPQIRRRLAILAAIPTATMDTGSFTYTQESGAFDGPVETAELAMKPPGTANFADAECVAVTIPAWLKIARQQLADLPMLQATLTGRLMHSVQRRIENQIVAGDGTGQNLTGILHTSGIGSIAFSTSEALSDLTLDAITTVLVSDAVPDLAIFNPLDVAAMLKAKASTSGVRLDSPGAFAATSNTIWDLPRVTSTAMPVGTALVGDFALGCTLFVREGVMVRLSDSDQDDFVKNRSTLLAEARVGLAIWQPTAFAKVLLAA
jgi:HK97 family phage major capsid protein